MRNPLPTVVTAANVTLLAAVIVVALRSTEAPAEVAPPSPMLSPTKAPSPPRRAAWTPPEWLSGAASAAGWVLQDLDADPVATQGPKVRARSVFLADLDTGEVLYVKDADNPHPVASLTKMVSALALVSAEPDLERKTCIGHEQHTTRSGARSKFETGSCRTGWEYLGAALVRSDNRGAMSLPAVADLPYDEFIARMNEVSEQIGMEVSSWTDPTGLEDENMASARDIAKAVTALSLHPITQIAASARMWSVDGKKHQDWMHTTNRLFDRYETVAAKTGFTSTANYCFSAVVRNKSGRTFVVAVLGAPTDKGRFTDASALLSWAEGR